MGKMIKGAIELKELGDAVFLGNYESGSEEWHNLRNEDAAIGGSDIGAIAGLSPWESAITKWAKKTGKISDDVEPNMSMRLGNKLETPILEIFAEEHPDYEIFTTGTWAHKDFSWQRANPDALYLKPDGTWGIIEVKFSRDYWSEVPQHYRAQVLWYMNVFGIQEAVLVALAGSSYQEFDVEWDSFEATSLIAAAYRFRESVLKEEMPDWDGSNSTFETIRAMNPKIEDGEEHLDELGVHYFNALTDFEHTEKRLTELKSRVLKAMAGKKRGIVYGEHAISLRARGMGNPYIHNEKGKK
jgi:putative phage-type endonuclease